VNSSSHINLHTKMYVNNNSQILKLGSI